MALGHYKKIFIILIIILIVGAVFYFKNIKQAETPVVPTVEKQVEKQAEQKKIVDTQIKNIFQPPLTRAGERVTKKPFGIFITPHNSPVQPEKFSGYHAGADFETFPKEENAEILVKAICSGELKMKKTATGYGGVAVQACQLDNNPITVIYGHLKLSSVAKNTGENIEAEETIGILGKGFSAETSGERKHLHLGIHKGADINIIGYVQNQTELFNWINPCLYVCEKK